MNEFLERELVALLAELEPAIEQLAEQLIAKVESRIKDKLHTVRDRIAAQLESEIATKQ